MLSKRGKPVSADSDFALTAMRAANSEEHPIQSGDRQFEPTAGTVLVPKASGRVYIKETSSSVKARAPRYTILSTWWQELTAVLLLVAAALASFVTLYAYQGKPLPEWPHAVTIGALLSIYSLVLRSSATFLLAQGIAILKWQWYEKDERPLHDFVLHDNATRGPIGAITLLWRMPLPRTRQWLGCFLILVALLVGPFTQQVLRYETCSVLDKNTTQYPGIARTSVFIGQGDHESAMQNYLTTTEQNAVRAGLYVPGQAPVICNSSNCTFAPYTSLGYCSRCEDRSANVSIKTANITLNQSMTEIYGTPLRTTTTLNIIPWYNNTFEDPNITAAFGGSDYFGRTSNYALLTDSGGSLWPINFLFGLTGIIDESTAHRKIISPIDPSTGASPLGCNSSNVEKSWRCRGYAAASCYVYPCISTYTAKATNGDLQEYVLNETTHDQLDGIATDDAPVTPISMWPDGRLVYSVLNVSCPSTEQRVALQKLNYTLPDHSALISYTLNVTNLTEGTRATARPVTPSDFRQLDRDLISAGCVYMLDYQFHRGLEVYMQQTFGGSLLGTRGAHTDQVIQLQGSELLQMAYNYGNYSLELTDSLMKDISLSLTRHVRTNPGLSSSFKISTSANGDAYETKTCVRVAWAWLTPPLALVVLSLVFFVSVLLTCRKLERDVRTWKSSSLPLIFYGPGAKNSKDEPLAYQDSRDIGMTQHIDDLNEEAKNTNAALIRDDDGLMTLRERVNPEGCRSIRDL